jgi:hypothetical protein
MVTSEDIDYYIREARRNSITLCKKFSTRYPLAAWIQDKNPQSGQLDDETYYSYHGHGCTFTKKNDEDYELNLDYWNDNIIINPLKLIDFINKEYVYSDEELKNVEYHIYVNKKVNKKFTLFGESYIVEIFS